MTHAFLTLVYISIFLLLAGGAADQLLKHMDRKDAKKARARRARNREIERKIKAITE